MKGGARVLGREALGEEGVSKTMHFGLDQGEGFPPLKHNLKGGDNLAKYTIAYAVLELVGDSESFQTIAMFDTFESAEGYAEDMFVGYYHERSYKVAKVLLKKTLHGRYRESTTVLTLRKGRNITDAKNPMCSDSRETLC